MEYVTCSKNYSCDRDRSSSQVRVRDVASVEHGREEMLQAFIKTGVNNINLEAVLSSRNLRAYNYNIFPEKLQYKMVNGDYCIIYH